MVYRRHTHRSSFWWQSKLTDDRKDEIIEWVKSLSDKDAAVLEDLLDDVSSEAHLDGYDEGAYEYTGEYND